jgi:hypothetical protein
MYVIRVFFILKNVQVNVQVSVQVIANTLKFRL